MRFSYPDVAYDRSVVATDCWDRDLIAQCKADVDLCKWAGGRDKKLSCNRDLPESVLEVIDEAHSPAFILWLENVTGERGLLPDPTLKGGGVHRILRGGFLKLHTDFNYHAEQQWYRRLNLLLYLNPGWKREWGGALELGSQRVYPLANTMVVFTSDDDSLHGHPHPLACPEGVTRDSIALYYYVEQQPKGFRGKRLNTDYRG